MLWILYLQEKFGINLWGPQNTFKKPWLFISKDWASGEVLPWHKLALAVTLFFTGPVLVNISSHWWRCALFEMLKLYEIVAFNQFIFYCQLHCWTPENSWIVLHMWKGFILSTRIAINMYHISNFLSRSKLMYPGYQLFPVNSSKPNLSEPGNITTSKVKFILFRQM